MFGNKASFRRISLLLLFLSIVSIVSLVTCAQPPTSTKTPILSSDPVIHWIQQHAIPLRTTNPGGSDADLALLKQIVGRASIVGLGEGTHGTHEFIDMKARLVEFLISTMGFTTLVMENDWGSTQHIDAYINGGAGDITTLMSQDMFGSWQTQEYRTLLEWMRAYNANSAHPIKIHFLGMDCQAFDQNDFDAVENYLQKVDPQQVTRVQNLYKPIISNGVQAPLTYYRLDAATKQQYQTQAEQAYNLLQINQQRYINLSSSQQFALALQNARVIVQVTTFLNSNTSAEYLANYYQRDTFMAENVEWIDDHDAGAHPKIMVWAHDVHIANKTSYATQDGRNMGGELRARYKQSYLPIGMTFYQGTFRTYNYPSNSIQTISLPLSNTYNYTLGQAGRSLYMLDLRNIPPGPVANWTHSSSTFLLYGLDGQDLSTPAQLSQWFDVIIHIQNTTPSDYFYASKGSE